MFAALAYTLAALLVGCIILAGLFIWKWPERG